MTFAQSERAELADLLDQVGPEAPTLCEGWTSHDLAAHLWIRETDPVGAGGIVARPLAGLLDRRMVETKARWPYAELVDKVRNGPARFSVFAIPGVDEGANTIEYFVHHEDVRRAGDEPQSARTLPEDVEGWLWRRLKLLARAQFRRAKVGVVLEREGSRGRRRRAGDHPRRGRRAHRHRRRPPERADPLRARPDRDRPGPPGRRARGRRAAARLRAQRVGAARRLAA